MTTTLEPTDKLDAETSSAPFGAAGEVVVNGPEDDDLDWHAIDWRAVEDDVQRLRHRIFTASQAVSAYEPSGLAWAGCGDKSQVRF